MEIAELLDFCFITVYQLFINMSIIIWFSADVSIFKPSSFYIVIQAHLIGLRLEIQLVPLMQLYIAVSSVYQGETCGIYFLQTFYLYVRLSDFFLCFQFNSVSYINLVNNKSIYRSLWQFQQHWGWWFHNHWWTQGSNRFRFCQHLENKSKLPWCQEKLWESLQS